jgi:formylglycine-generating enzyme required for sulfatase activity
MLKWLAGLFLPAAVFAAGDFVLIQGGLARPGNPSTRVDDFEMQDRPVTNAEYRIFAEETGHTPPLHWANGRVPSGMENWPVIFVNRYDVAAYTSWRGKKEGRAYRLPTAAEFDYAARGGMADAVYPWGKESPAGKANYDAKGDRTFAEWRQYLKPVKSYGPNRAGLYDMAGNVWQMVDTYPDPATVRYKYRIETPVERARGWQRGAALGMGGGRSKRIARRPGRGV